MEEFLVKKFLNSSPFVYTACGALPMLYHLLGLKIKYSLLRRKILLLLGISMKKLAYFNVAAYMHGKRL